MYGNVQFKFTYLEKLREADDMFFSLVKMTVCNFIPRFRNDFCLLLTANGTQK